MSGRGSRRPSAGDSTLPTGHSSENLPFFVDVPSAIPCHPDFPGGVVVAKLPRGTDPEDVKKEFLKFGPIEKVEVQDGVCCIGCFVVFLTFTNPADARRAIRQSDNKKILGVKCIVHHQHRAPASTNEDLVDLETVMNDEAFNKQREEAKKRREKEAKEAANRAKAKSLKKAKLGRR